MSKTAYGIHNEEDAIVVTEEELVGKGNGDIFTPIYGAPIRLSTRRIREVTRFPKTQAGKKQAVALCEAHAETLK